MSRLLYILALLLGLSQARAQITNTGLPIGITEGAILSSGDITSQGTLTNNGLLSLSGNLSLSTYSGQGNVSLRGEEQLLDFGGDVTVGVLTTEGPQLKTFEHGVTVNESLTLTNGWLTSGNNDFLISDGATVGLGSDASYVQGRLIRRGSTSMLFPVGVNNVYTPLTLLQSGGSTADIAVSVTGESTDGLVGRGLDRLSNVRYWDISSESVDYAGAQVQLALRNEDVVTDIAEVAMAYTPEGSDLFRAIEGTSVTGTLEDGLVTSGGIVPPGRLAIGRFFDETLRVSDSLALVALYEETEGGAWANTSGWRTTLLDEWFGVGLVDKRVDEIDLSSNNLKGALSEASIPRLSELSTLDLSENEITVLPNLDGLSKLTTVDVSNNSLDFSSLENQSQLSIMEYAPQSLALSNITAVAELGDPIGLSRVIGGSSNAYTWQKDGQDITSGSGGVFEIASALVEDEGAYSAQVANSRVPDLTLTTQPVDFFVSSLERDRRALLALYDSTNGSGWQDPLGAEIRGWDQDTDISEWSYVQLNASGVRVEQLNLNAIGMIGPVPPMMTAMTFLREMNMANNELTELPRLANISGLQTLDVTSNRLGFDAIQPNLTIPNFSFSPQRLLAEEATIKVPQGTPYTFGFPAGGEGLRYRWFHNGAELTEEKSATLTIDSVNFEDMGDYRLVVTDQLIATQNPSFRLETGDQELLATSNISGSVRSIEGQTITEGEVTLWGIRPLGTAYDSVGTYAYSGNQYLIPNVVLGDYIHWVIGDLTQHLPSYYRNSFTWSAADTVELRQNVSGQDITMIDSPVDLVPDPANDNTINGVLELDTDNFPPGTFNEGNRTLARRRVRRAGCGFSRALFVDRGADEEVFELIYYTLTDENGNFEAQNLPDGFYRLQIEYPGVPMDPNSFVEFELGGGGTIDQNTLNLTAEVKPDGVVVTKVEETGIYRNYFKDLNVFPNPADDYLEITYERLNTDGIMVQVMDLNGAIQIEQEIPKGFDQRVELEVIHLTPGIYIMTFMDMEQGVRSITSLKFIIER